MSKQIKLGFDKNTSRPVSTDQILVDVRGNLLRDSAGDFLFTETTRTPQSFFSERNATSVHVNNEPTPIVRRGGSVAIRELFSETSEVSKSLLGIPRAERQQTLLSDVSIYGRDPNTWEFFRNGQPFQPREWATRTNTTYGRRYDPRVEEYSGEQALAIELFPTPWTFPFGPGWEGQGRFNPTLFEQYTRFIQLGNALYEYYASSHNQIVFAQKHFLNPSIVFYDGTDVIYDENTDIAFELIEQWTVTWMDIRDNRQDDPLTSGRKLTSGTVNRIFANVLGFNFAQTQPGYSSTPYRYCQLQSKEAFRYQPGAISSFTFGTKLNSDPSTLSNFLEWGAANDTDQLMFQVRGSQFNLIRRSTVPLTRKNLELNGFTLEDQKQIQPPNPFERADNAEISTDIGVEPLDKPPMYELVIPSDKFNGDPLDGSGPSGYNISFNEVTMYKIDYSWYGAIGAKFYAYIPVGNDETRWVLIHTLIIENTLGEPSLQNPFMHFRYSIYLNDTSSLREPIFLYKYGASYYIDGDDQGTFSYNSYKLPTEKTITSVNSIPLMGFYPKQQISNRDAIGTTNQKNFYIENISAFSDRNTRLDILECDGCPGGHGHFYATALENGQRGTEDEFIITNTNELIFADPSKSFGEFSGDKKIIAPGIFSSYIFPITQDQQRARIRRRTGSNRINTPIDQTGFSSADTARVSGENFSPLGHQFFGRLSGFDDIAASTVPITKPNIKVQFLNPIRRESTGQFAEFRIGITSKIPKLSLPEGESEEILLFDDEYLDLETEIFGEFAQYQAQKNIQGVEVGEWEPRSGITMQQELRIGNPRGPSSGSCSELNFEILEIPITGVQYSTTDPSGQLEGDHFIIFDAIPPITNLIGGGIGIFDGNKYVNSGLTFTSNFTTYFNQATSVNNFVAAISDDISLLVDIANDGIAVKSVRCFGRYINKTKVIAFGANEFYLFVAMRDNARINNIIVQEFDDVDSFSHTPNWIIGADSNIQTVQVGNSPPGSDIMDKLPTSNEYIGIDGRFNMGGTTFTGNTPANFKDVNRLDSVQFDNQLSLPLRPASLKTSIYLGANSTETITMNHIFNIDRFKITKGTFNNKYIHFSSIVTDPNETGTIQLNISGREQ